MSHAHEILHPRHWKPARGYANGVKAQGTIVALGGQVGWDADQVFRHHDFVGQAEQAMNNILELLREAGAGPEHLVRLTWFVTDKRAYLDALRPLGEAYRRVFGKSFPAMSLVQVVALVEDEALVEIEATAVVPLP